MCISILKSYLKYRSNLSYAKVPTYLHFTFRHDHEPLHQETQRVQNEAICKVSAFLSTPVTCANCDQRAKGQSLFGKMKENERQGLENSKSPDDGQVSGP